MKVMQICIFSFVFPVLFSLSISAHAGVIVPEENLVISGIPELNDRVIEDTRAYTDFRPTVFESWHPLRPEMLVMSRPPNGQTAQIYQLQRPMDEKNQITFYEERIGGVTFQPKNGSYFVFSQDTGGGEWFQNYRYDISTQEVTLLTDGKSKNSLGVWSKKGDRMAYGSTRRNGKDTDFYVINPLDRNSNKMIAQLSQGDAWHILDWSPDDSQILALEYISINESYLWIFDVESGNKTLVTPNNTGASEKVYYDNAKFSKDGKSIFLTTDKDSEFIRLARLDLDTTKLEFFDTGIQWNVESMKVSPDGKQIAFVTNEAGVSVLHFLDVDTKAISDVKSIPIGVISGITWHPAGKHLAFNLSSARSPTDVYSLEFGSYKLTRWTQTETPGLDVNQFTEPRLVEWESFDKRKISGFLYPASAKFKGKRPVMIIIHGGPEAQFRPTFLARYNYYLNEMGIALFFPNIRGSTGYGKTFLQLDNGYLREDSYKDIGALLDWIKAQSDLDGDRILVTGGSYGGHVTLAVATLYNEKIACSIDIVGMSNLVTFLKNTEPYRQDLRRVEYGDERIPEMREFLEKIAPLNHASKITKPLFVIQGRNDPRVPYTEAEQMVATVSHNSTPVWFLMAKDEGHGFLKKKNIDFQFYSTLSFIENFLLER